MLESYCESTIEIGIENCKLGRPCNLLIVIFKIGISLLFLPFIHIFSQIKFHLLGTKKIKNVGKNCFDLICCNSPWSIFHFISEIYSPGPKKREKRRPNHRVNNSGCMVENARQNGRRDRFKKLSTLA